MILLHSCEYSFAAINMDREKKRPVTEAEKGELEKFRDRDNDKNKTKKTRENTVAEPEKQDTCITIYSPVYPAYRPVQYPLFEKNPEKQSCFKLPCLNSQNNSTIGYLSGSYRTISPNVHSCDMDMKLNLYPAAGFTLNIQQYKEKDMNTDDQLGCYRCSIFYHLYSNSGLIADINLGVRFLDIYSSMDYGFRLMIFPVNPLSLNLDYSACTLDSDPFYEFNVSAGVMINRYEIFAGYRSITWAANRLDGPLFGGRLWL